MHFLKPELLWLLPFSASGMFVMWLAWCRRRQLISTWGRRQRSSSKWTAASYAAKACLLTMMIGAALVALARPSTSNSVTEFPAGTTDVVVLLDVSRSMAADDCIGGKTRLHTAKEILAKKVIPSLNNNQLGIVTFAGKAMPQVFLTYEMKTVSWLVQNELKINSAPGEGSALGQAFAMAFRLFESDSAHDRTKVVLLFSDGGTDDDTSSEKIAAACRQRGIQLVVFGLGRTTPSMIPVKELSPEDQMLSVTEFYKIDGEIAKTALDEGLLGGLAKLSGGSYLKVGAAENVRWSPLVSRLETRTRVSEKEHFRTPIFVFLCCLLGAGLVNRGNRPRPYDG